MFRQGIHQWWRRKQVTKLEEGEDMDSRTRLKRMLYNDLLREMSIVDQFEYRLQKAGKKTNTKGYDADFNPTPTDMAHRANLKARAVMCEICGKNKAEIMHHYSYANLGHEEGGDVAIVCVECHVLIHNVLGKPMESYASDFIAQVVRESNQKQDYTMNKPIILYLIL